MCARMILFAHDTFLGKYVFHDTQNRIGKEGE